MEVEGVWVEKVEVKGGGGKIGGGTGGRVLGCPQIYSNVIKSHIVLIVSWQIILNKIF